MSSIRVGDNVFDRDTVLYPIAGAWKILENPVAIIVCTCRQHGRGYLDGIPLTCIFAEAGASPVRFPREHDVESDQPGFLEPADIAAIDRAAGSRLSVTKGPKCAFSLSLFVPPSFSLFLSLPPYPFPTSAISFSSRRTPRGRIRFFGDFVLKR